MNVLITIESMPRVGPHSLQKPGQVGSCGTSGEGVSEVDLDWTLRYMGTHLTFFAVDFFTLVLAELGQGLANSGLDPQLSSQQLTYFSHCSLKLASFRLFDFKHLRFFTSWLSGNSEQERRSWASKLGR